MSLSVDLIQGHNFLKYGRRGKPKQRHVSISSKEDMVM